MCVDEEYEIVIERVPGFGLLNFCVEMGLLQVENGAQQRFCKT